MNTPAQPAPAVRTTCPYCGVGCGLAVRPNANGADVIGDPDHPANFGATCSKGSALGETLSLDGRLLHPMQRGSDGVLKQVSWNAALDAVADGFSRIVERDGPDAVAFYLSGQLLTEDYYVANKLMKGFIGTANVDTNSRLCMASSVAGHRRAFGADTVPGLYGDLDQADLIVLVGSNAAWCHPVLFQRIMRNKTERVAKVVVIDPRRTASADDADLFLPVAPGMDSSLFAGLLVHLASNGACDEEYVRKHTSGFDAAVQRAREIAPSIRAVARATGLAETVIAEFYDLFRATPRVVTCYSQGVNQSAQGTDKVNAIINCHLATGRIGQPGMGPFSLTGQPNAMGGREVGGLANMLAAHMGFSAPEVDRVRRFWNAPRMAEREGLKAVQMFEAIGRGEIKALWVMATNPAVSLPDAEAVRDALRKLELFVVSENVLSNDTVNCGAQILLPAAAWGEKDGTVTNSERRISRQRKFLPLPGEARPDWQIVSDVAARMGFSETFSFDSPASIFREHAALSTFENDGTRDFDIGALADISDADYEALEPVVWPQRSGEVPSEQRFFADGKFFTSDRKARFVAIEPPALRDMTSADFPLRLNTGRVRDPWHTMTRTGKSPRLGGHMPEPFVEIHPNDARRAHVVDGGHARISGPRGMCVLKVVITDTQQEGSLFVPIHWSSETASSARIGALVATHTDPYSGQPEAKASAVAISPAWFPLRGFVRTKDASMPGGNFWSRVAVAGGEEFRVASAQGLMQWHDFAHDLMPPDATLVERLDAGQRTYQAAAFIDGAVAGQIAIGPANVVFDWSELQPPLQGGTPASNIAALFLPSEPVVCACFGVTERAVRDLIEKGEARDLDTIGRCTSAGTNCGSCRPELKRMLKHAALAG